MVLLFAVVQFASTSRAADQSSPATSNVPGAPTPSIHLDRRITFTLKAPDARTVEVAGGDGLGMGPFPMAKDADGMWRVTTPPAVPGFHYYWFVLDGVSVNDPSSESKHGAVLSTISRRACSADDPPVKFSECQPVALSGS